MNSHKTAIARRKLSRPARIFEPYLYGKVLDFGCGRGTDADILHAHKYDPHYFPVKPEKKSFDCVMCIYVLNTIEGFPDKVLKKALTYLKPGGLIMVATRTVNEVRSQAKKNNWKSSGRGWVTSRETFQRGLGVEELSRIVRDYEMVKGGHRPFSYIIARKPSEGGEV